jgi:probable rRNA maturation factor
MAEQVPPRTADDVSEGAGESRSRVISIAALEVEIVQVDGAWDGALPRLDGAVHATLAALVAEVPEMTGTATLALSTDNEMRALNRQFRGHDKPTNVLSFPAGGRAVDGVLGDVVLALETLEKEANTLGIPLVHHLQHLVVHGLLHLVGHDHETEADAARMESLESRILARLGVDDPYREPAMPSGKRATRKETRR